MTAPESSPEVVARAAMTKLAKALLILSAIPLGWSAMFGLTDTGVPWRAVAVGIALVALAALTHFRQQLWVAYLLIGLFVTMGLGLIGAYLADDDAPSGGAIIALAFSLFVFVLPWRVHQEVVVPFKNARKLRTL